MQGLGTSLDKAEADTEQTVVFLSSECCMSWKGPRPTNTPNKRRPRPAFTHGSPTFEQANDRVQPVRHMDL